MGQFFPLKDASNILLSLESPANISHVKRKCFTGYV